MRKVDGYLSNLAQQDWPTALVWKEEVGPVAEKGPSERFVLEREGMEGVILGNHFKEARAGLAAMMSSERSRRKSFDRKEN